MYKYCQRATIKATAKGSTICLALNLTAPKAQYWEDLTAQYGLDSIDTNEVYGHAEQTVAEEYSAYVTASLSIKGTDLIKF